MSKVLPTGPSPNASVAQPPRRRADAIKYAWARGASPDTCAALAGDPDLLADKSIVLDLAYEEYCLRREAGEEPEVETYCDRFPNYRSSLRRLLAAHQFLVDNSDLLSSVDPVRWPEPGQAFGDHTLLRELGRGSFARVFLATEASTGDRPVAVKLSLEGAAEAKTLGRLDHPNIVPILSARQADNGLSVVCMPYLGSATMHDLLDQAYPEKGARPPERGQAILDAVRSVTTNEMLAPARPAAVELTRGSFVDGVVHLGVQLADALAFIHARGICHRDFKPSNILIDPSGRPLLLDFNLSSDPRMASSRAGGTLPYMAPEQVRLFVSARDCAADVELDGRADIYSLGVVLYELLTGKNPFGPLPLGLSPDELSRALLARQEEGCRPLRELNPIVGPRLARVVESCLAFSREDRPAEAAALAAELRRHFATSARMRRWARRRPKILATAACAMLLSIAVAAYALATRAPAWERAYHKGIAAYRAGDFAASDRWLDESLRLYQSNGAAWFARGRVRLAQGDIALAMTYFENANHLESTGRTAAMLAYCEALRHHHPEAILLSDSARQAGFAPPALLANLAFSRMRSGDLEGARGDVHDALAADPNLTSAHYTRAMLAYLGWLADTNVPLPPQAIEDIQFVLRNGRPSAQLFQDAAMLFAAAAGRPDSPSADEAVACIRKALDHGASALAFRNDPILRARLTGHRDFPAVLDTPAGVNDDDANFNGQLCDPLAGQLD